MELIQFCRELPKVELHAHLNGSLSRSTMMKLIRWYADADIPDKTNAFLDEFKIGAGDTRNFSESFQAFSIAHSLTTTPQALELATFLTLQEFQDDGCCYIELRSTPKETEYMSKKQYIDTLIQTIKKSSDQLNIIARLIISINRNSNTDEANNIADLAVEYFKAHPDVVVGIELSGDPTIGRFEDFKPVLSKAKNEGMKVSLHCGEVCNPKEVAEMLLFKPQRIGHGVCIHPRLGGNDEIWSLLCKSKTPVEVCLTSNVNTKSTPDYESHHFKEMCDADIPVIICTDDKGVFSTSLSQEYILCAETFKLTKSQIAQLALKSCEYVFADSVRALLKNRVSEFIAKKC